MFNTELCDRNTSSVEVYDDWLMIVWWFVGRSTHGCSVPLMIRPFASGTGSPVPVSGVCVCLPVCFLWQSLSVSWSSWFIVSVCLLVLLVHCLSWFQSLCLYVCLGFSLCVCLSVLVSVSVFAWLCFCAVCVLSEFRQGSSGINGEEEGKYFLNPKGIHLPFTDSLVWVYYCWWLVTFSLL